MAKRKKSRIKPEITASDDRGAPRMRTRIWVNGQVVVDEEITLSSAGSIGPGHVELVEAAEQAGDKWLVEISDPEGELAPVRWGSDTAGMVWPIQFDPSDLPSVASRIAARKRPWGND